MIITDYNNNNLHLFPKLNVFTIMQVDSFDSSDMPVQKQMVAQEHQQSQLPHMSEFEAIRRLGKGAQATVYEARCATDND